MNKRSPCAVGLQSRGRADRKETSENPFGVVVVMLSEEINVGWKGKFALARVAGKGSLINMPKDHRENCI